MKVSSDWFVFMPFTECGLFLVVHEDDGLHVNASTDFVEHSNSAEGVCGIMLVNSLC